MQEIVHNLLELILRHIILSLQLLVYISNHLFVRLFLPDSIASHYYEVFVTLQIENVSVRVGGDCLLLRREVLTSLVLEVTDTAGQVQISIDSSVGDGAAGLLNAINFSLLLWLMID